LAALSRYRSLAGSITGDAMAYSVELAELFDVDVDQFAGMFALIAPHRPGRSPEQRILNWLEQKSW
jgi:hypothetical protein